MKCRVIALVIVLTILMSSSAMAATINMDSMFPVTEEPVTMSMCMLRSASSAEDPNDLWFFRYYNEATNVIWEITEIDSAAWGDMKGVMMASGDYPDVFYGPTFTPSEIIRYGSEGIFIDLKDYIAEYAPNFNKLLDENPEARAGMLAPDGNMYSFLAFEPMIEDWYCTMYSYRQLLNQQWLENLDLEMPETIEELYDVLLAFKNEDANGNGDPTDEIPFSGIWSGDNGRGYLLSAWGVLAKNGLGNYVAMKDDEVRFMPLMDEYKEYLTFMNKCWENGLIDPAFFTQGDTDLQAKFAIEDGVFNIGMTTTTSIFNAMTGYEQYSQYLCMSPILAGDNTEKMARQSDPFSIGVMQVTDKCEYPEVAVRWADIFYDPYQSWISANGPDYGTEEDLDMTGAKYNDPVYEYPVGYYTNNEGDYGIWEWFCRYIGPRNKGTPWHTGVYDQWGKYYAYDGENMADYRAYPKEELDGIQYTYIITDDALRGYQKVGYVETFLSLEDTEKVTELLVPLQDYVDSMSAKFITGDESLENYDAFVERMIQLGADEIDKIYHDTYENAKANSAK